MKITHATSLRIGAAVLFSYTLVSAATVSAQSVVVPNPGPVGGSTTLSRIANTAAAIQGQPAPYQTTAPGAVYQGYASPNTYSRGYSGFGQPAQQPVFNGYGYVQPQAQPVYNGYGYVQPQQPVQNRVQQFVQPQQTYTYNGYTYTTTPQHYIQPQQQPLRNGVQRVQNAIQSVIQPQSQPYTYQYVMPR